MATWQSTSNGKSHHQVPAHGPVVPQRCEECGGAFKVRSPLHLYLCLRLFLYMCPCLRARIVSPQTSARVVRILKPSVETPQTCR
jgi:hypothetical protein